LAVESLIDIPHAEDRAIVERELRRILSDRPGSWFVSVLEPQHSSDWHLRLEGPGFSWSVVLSRPDELTPSYVVNAIRNALATDPVTIRKLVIAGFGPFAATVLHLNSLQVLVGANGSGKSSVFELLRAIREFVRVEIPAEIIPGWGTREVYHRPGPDRLSWRMILRSAETEYSFDADIVGPPGNAVIDEEIVSVEVSTDVGSTELARLERRGDAGYFFDSETVSHLQQVRPNELAFRSYVNPGHRVLYRLKEQIESWRFFSGIRFNDSQMRQPSVIEKSPALRDDGGNLASVLNWLRNESPSLFNEIELHIRGIIPGFRALGVSPSGAGRVTLTWDEEGLLNPLTAADLSDGSLRLLLWLTLALTPNPPSLVCIDEPEVGLHPRTLPTIAALLKKLSKRTQILVATHSSYLLAQFDVGDIAILRKRNGTIEFSKPGTSAALLENLREFGAEELELMHRSDELEALT
jgi:predicted ATPase